MMCELRVRAGLPVLLLSLLLGETELNDFDEPEAALEL